MQQETTFQHSATPDHINWNQLLDECENVNNRIAMKPTKNQKQV